jgi:DNA modification methylase
MNIKNNKLLNEYKPEFTTCWSFPKRGDWATHSSKFRGNFAPQIPRNLIEMYSSEGELILDPMVGSGTTLIEARLLNRNAIGIDVNPDNAELAKTALGFENASKSKQTVMLGDARNLEKIKDNSIDLIVTHPPYLDIVEYSKGKIPADLSNIGNVDKFCDEIEVAAKEMFRVLKPNRYCGILIGDTRKGQHYVPLSYYVLQKFLKAGFVLKEEIIKSQHNCMYSKRWQGSAGKYKFYLIMHEHLFVFRKPALGENTTNIKWSMYNKGIAGEK